jgi:two-component system chemotaxis family response regulator WspR
VANRRRLDDYLGVVWEQCRERGRPLSVLAIDVDHFKQFNDSRGHLAGDELLKQLVQRLNACLRRSEDLLARYGGEEFLVVLPGAERAVAQALAESMREALASSGLGVTISVGVASRIPAPDEPVTSVVEKADAALYQAKSAGRNCVR